LLYLWDYRNYVELETLIEGISLEVTQLDNSENKKLAFEEGAFKQLKGGMAVLV